jgi:hypothetical protein
MKTMFNPIPTLLAVLTTGYILSALADVPLCFYPDGSQAQSDYACNLTAEHSFCCAIGYNCLDNKICVAEGYSDWNRGSCTDKTWNSPDCPRFCMDFSSSGGSWLVNCGEKDVCCYDTLAEFPNDCCSANLTGQNPVSMLPGEPTPFTLITSGASTQTRSLSSSSSSSSTATSTTSSNTASTTTSSTGTTSTSITPSSTPSPIDSSPSPTSAASSSNNTLTTGAYVGIAIGIAAAIGLLGAFIFLFRRRQRSNRQQTQSPMMPLVSPAWNNNNSPDFPHGDKEQGHNSYEYRTSEVAQLHELTAESERPELRGETLLELEGSDRQR